MRPLVLGVLVGSFLVACGSRAGLLDDRAAASGDGGTAPRAPASVAADAGAMVDSGATLDGGGGAACKIPPQARSRSSDGIGECIPNLHINWSASYCASSQYELDCRGSLMDGPPEPDPSLGCIQQPFNDTLGGTYYCCPCEGAAAACVYVDLSTYDRSCNKDADCVEITSGKVCSGDCLCGTCAINNDGLTRYRQTLAPLRFGLCGCPADHGAHCIQGVCSY